MKKRSDITAVIVVKDGARTISGCIQALQNVLQHIIVAIDDQTSDETEMICKDLRVECHLISWQGFSTTKNLVAALAKTEWILSIDADEIINEDLQQSILHLDLKPSTVYAFNRLSFIGETAIRHSGWFPDWVSRLYNKNEAQWNVRLVHEGLTLKKDNQIVRLEGVAYHYSYVDFHKVERKFDNYALLRAKEWISKSNKPPILKRLFGPYFRVLKTYILNRGFLDGNAGLQLAKLEFELKRKELNYFKKLRKS